MQIFSDEGTVLCQGKVSSQTVAKMGKGVQPDKGLVLPAFPKKGHPKPTCMQVYTWCATKSPSRPTAGSEQDEQPTAEESPAVRQPPLGYVETISQRTAARREATCKGGQGDKIKD